MNVLTVFDQRINAIFEEATPGVQPPFSFKRLAKRAVRAMEDETFVIDGVDTAPALYTILISQLDDSLMRHMYVRITDEISQLVEAQAKKRGYTFVGRPLVRFMVDPALRSGRFSLFAENVDPRTLARLRDEENAYLGITPPQEIIVEHGFMPEPVPITDEEPAPVAQESQFVSEISQEDVVSLDDDFEPLDAQEAMSDFDGLKSMDAIIDQDEEPVSGDDIFERDEAFAAAYAPEGISDESSEVITAEHMEPEPQVTDSDDLYDDFMGESISVSEAAAILAADAEEDDAESVSSHKDDSILVEDAQEEDFVSSPTDEPFVPDFIQQAAARKAAEPVCTLTNLSSGEVFTLSAARTPVGRERIPGGVILRDPNVSRRHAEILFDGNTWRIRDLDSTNGTVVNNTDVPEAILQDGDILTLGITELEFKVN